MHPALATEAELDAACRRMLPPARRFVAAVSSRRPDAVRAGFADVQQVETPAGVNPTTVLAYVLADQLAAAEAVPTEGRVAAAATRLERDRCIKLALDAARGGDVGVIDRARRLPARIAAGDLP